MSPLPLNALTMAATVAHVVACWVVTCTRHGHIGAAIHMARDRADQLVHDHNQTCHLTEEKETQP